MSDHPNFGAIYRPGDCAEVTSDKNEKINIRGVPSEHLQVAIAKLSAPRKNSNPMTGTPGLRRLGK